MTNIDKTFGARTSLSGGLYKGFNPDVWLESLFRVLKTYVERNSSEAYEIRFSFPEADERAEFVKIPRTVIHFEIDDIDNPKYGFGDNVVSDLVDDTEMTIVEHEAIPHVVNFDIGIWASPSSGGLTSRMRAYQIIDRLFCGSTAFQKAQAEADIEIINFTGGTFAREKVSDVPLFRAMGITLVVRVFERRTKDAIPYIDTIEQDPMLEIPS